MVKSSRFLGRALFFNRPPLALGPCRCYSPPKAGERTGSRYAEKLMFALWSGGNKYVKRNQRDRKDYFIVLNDQLVNLQLLINHRFEMPLPEQRSSLPIRGPENQTFKIKGLGGKIFCY